MPITHWVAGWGGPEPV